MTDGGLPVWAVSIIFLMISFSPILLIVLIAFAVRRRRARTEAAARTQRPSVPEPSEPPPELVEMPSQAAPAAPVAESLGSRIGNWVGAAIVALFFIRVAVALVTWCIPDFRMLPPSLPKLAGHIGDYLEISGLKWSRSDGALQGKAVIVDRDKGTLHPLMRGLPKPIRASAPDEVDFVIWIDSERVSDPGAEIVAAAKPTSEEIAAWQSKHPLDPGIPTDSVTVPVYKAKWTVTVINFKNKEIMGTKSFVGPSLPDGKLDFRSPPLSGQCCLYVDNKMVAGAEVLFGEDGRVFVGGKPLRGVVAPVPWGETLEWIEGLMGE